MVLGKVLQLVQCTALCLSNPTPFCFVCCALPSATGVVLAGVLGKVMELVKGGPQKMQEMAMQQMMKQMMKQMGAPPGELVELIQGSCRVFYCGCRMQQVK